MTFLRERLLVDGCEIAWGAWGDVGPALTLLHGAGVHAGWWSAVIPELARNHRVTALDFSGHGDSGWRDHYRAEQWAKEAVEVAARQGTPVVLVGHSIGARIALVAAGLYPALVSKLVLVDPPIPPAPTASGRASGRRRWYATQEEALASFAFRPPQPTLDPDLVLSVSRLSLRREEYGWTWKFDPRTFGKVGDPVLLKHIGNVACEVVLARGEHTTVVTEEKVSRLRELLGRPFPDVVIAGAYHHVPLDRPRELAGAIERHI